MDDFVRKEYAYVVKANKIPEMIEKREKNITEIRDFLLDSLFSQKYAGTSLVETNAINEYLLTAIVHDYDEERIKAYLSRKDIDEDQANKIYRIEKHELKSKVREYAFIKNDPTGMRKYRWIGPSDHRTTWICEEITKRSKEGLSMEELKELLRDVVEEAKASGRLDARFAMREWTPHWLCRHVAIEAL